MSNDKKDHKDDESKDEDYEVYPLPSSKKLRERLEESYNVTFDKKDWENRDPDHIIAERLNEIIDAYDLNRTDFCIKVDISESYLSNLIKCRRPVTESIARKICRKTGINYRWFLRGKGPILMNDSFSIVQKLANINAKITQEDARFLEFLFSVPVKDRITFYKFFKGL